MNCSTPGFLSVTNSRSLLKLKSIESVMPSNHLILCHPLLLLPSIFPSIRVFSKESVLPIMWPKHWSFSFSVSPSNEYSGLISCKIDWFDFLAVQRTLKSLVQHHSSKPYRPLISQKHDFQSLFRFHPLMWCFSIQAAHWNHLASFKNMSPQPRDSNRALPGHLDH